MDLKTIEDLYSAMHTSSSREGSRRRLPCPVLWRTTRTALVVSAWMRVLRSEPFTICRPDLDDLMTSSVVLTFVRSLLLTVVLPVMKKAAAWPWPSEYLMSLRVC